MKGSLGEECVGSGIKVIISAVLVPIDAKHTWSLAPRSKSPKFVKMRVIFSLFFFLSFLKKECRNGRYEDIRFINAAERRVKLKILFQKNAF